MQQAGRVRTGNGQRGAAVGESVAALQGSGESFAELAHDARNMVTALALYCELLDEPGVLNPAARHFAQDLRVVTAASRRLLEKLARVEQRGNGRFAGPTLWRFSPMVEALPGTRSCGAPVIVEADRSNGQSTFLSAEGQIENLAEELESNHNLLATLAGPGVKVRVKAVGGDCPVRLNGEDLTRVLVNLVRNASEAMQGSGAINIELSECDGEAEDSPRVRLAVEDNGPGIPDTDLERVFEAGYSARNPQNGSTGRKSSRRCGLGLSITRNLVEAAGGHVVAGNGTGGGARICIELPVRLR